MVIFRFFQISVALWAFATWWLLVRLHLLRPAEHPARRLSRVLERLGTTFVKLGQGVGLRRDLLPDEYVAELATSFSLHRWPSICSFSLTAHGWSRRLPVHAIGTALSTVGRWQRTW